MKHLNIMICALSLCLLASACKKEDKPEPENKTTTTPPSGHFYTSLVDGIMVGDNPTDTIIAVQGGDIMVMIHAEPTKPSGTSVDAGLITLNGKKLEQEWVEEDPYLYVSALEYEIEDYDLVNGTNWVIAGKGSIPAMSYNDTRKHPDYTGVIPDKIDKSKGITITFNASTVSNADSITIAFGADVDLNYIWSKTFAANAGSVTITPADLAGLSPDMYGISIVPFTYTIQNFGGKPYAFTRSKQIVRTATVK